MKFRQFTYALAILLVGLVSGCVTVPHYDQGFRLPIADADIVRGARSFVSMQCNQCHTIKDYEIPAYDGDMPVKVELGGVILNAKTYGDLTTSIINPNYRLSERYLKQFPGNERKNIKSSPMHGAIQDLKVSELIDLVAFLDSRYHSVSGYLRYDKK